MIRAQAVREIEQAGATASPGPFLRFSFDGGRRWLSFFPNHHENMRRGEVQAYVMGLKPSVVERRRPQPLASSR